MISSCANKTLSSVFGFEDKLLITEVTLSLVSGEDVINEFFSFSISVEAT